MQRHAAGDGGNRYKDNEDTDGPLAGRALPLAQILLGTFQQQVNEGDQRGKQVEGLAQQGGNAQFKRCESILRAGLRHGLNWQHAARMAFVGVTDSFESYYQAVRRCWRFGQKRDVHVHLFSSSAEGAVMANLKRKEREAQAMADAMSAETLAAVRSEVFGFTKDTNIYQPSRQVAIPAFLTKEAS